MTLQTLVQRVKLNYGIKGTDSTRYSALDKIVNFLLTLERENGKKKSDIDILQEIEKKVLKTMYADYKVQQLQLSPTLSGAENQAINDLYIEMEKAEISVTSINRKVQQQISNVCTPTVRRTENTDADLKTGLEPMVGIDPKILILGTMPGNESLKQQAYYRDESRNKFWTIMHAIFHDDPMLQYEELLKRHNIALWDCLKAGQRQGSTDNGFNTESLVPNDMEKFIYEHPTIEVIILNGKGQTKESTPKIFDKYFSALRNKYRVIELNSTANTNSRLTVDEKTNEWMILKDL